MQKKTSIKFTFIDMHLTYQLYGAKQTHQKEAFFRLQLFMLSSGEKYLRHARAP